MRRNLPRRPPPHLLPPLHFRASASSSSFPSNPSRISSSVSSFCRKKTKSRLTVNSLLSVGLGILGSGSRLRFVCKITASGSPNYRGKGYERDRENEPVSPEAREGERDGRRSGAGMSFRFEQRDSGRETSQLTLSSGVSHDVS